MAGLSPEARKAKLSTEDGMRSAIAGKLHDNWNVLYPDVAYSAEALTKKLEEVTVDSVGTDGKPKKYNELAGQKIPTKSTIAKFGNAAAVAVDKGQNITEDHSGMEESGGFLGGIVGLILMLIPDSLIKWGMKTFAGMSDQEVDSLNMSTVNSAIKRWAGSGFSGSIKEHYATITSGDISGEFKQQMNAMSQDPEHRDFIKGNLIVERGEEQIRQSVMAAAGVIEPTPSRSLQETIALMKPPLPIKKPEVADLAKIGGKDAAEKVENTVKTVVDQTKENFGAALKSLNDKQKTEFAKAEAALLKNGKEIALTQKDLSAAQYTDAVILKTCKDCGFDIGDAKTAKDAAAKLPSDQAVLLNSFAANLSTAHVVISAHANGRTIDPEMLKASELQKKKNDVILAKEAAATAETALQAGMKETVMLGIRDAAVDGVISKSANGDALEKSAVNSGATGTAITFIVGSSRDTDKAKVDAAKDVLYEYAHTGKGTMSGGGYAPNPKQAKKLGELVAEATAGFLKDTYKPGMDAKQTSALLQKRVHDHLENNAGDIDKAGAYKISKINKNSKVDVLGDLSKKVATAIEKNVKSSANEAGAFDKLRQAYAMMVENPAKAVAAASAPEAQKFASAAQGQQPQVQVVPTTAVPTEVVAR